MQYSAARIIVISGHRFGAEVLSGLVASDSYKAGAIQIVAVLCLHPSHALATVGYFDMHQLAKSEGFPVAVFHSISSERVINYLSGIPHDYLFAVGLSQLIPPEILDLPMHFNNGQQRHSLAYGCIGMHPTNLPHGRGRAPLPWSIIYQLKDSAVTAFLLESEADSGNIVAKEPFLIGDGLNVGDVFKIVAACHWRLGHRLAPILASRSLSGEPQLGEVAPWVRRRPSDGWLDFSLPAEELLMLIRASAPPYPGAFFVVQDAILVVAEAEIVACEPLQAGVIIEAGDSSLTITTLDASLRLTKYQILGNTTPALTIGQSVLLPRETVIDED